MVESERAIQTILVGDAPTAPAPILGIARACAESVRGR